MTDIKAFISSYTETSRQYIAFTWNGKHSVEFQDSNQDFRWEVARQCISTPENSSPLLLEHLFLEDAMWAREAWGSPEHFAALGEMLLLCGQEAALIAFAKGFVSSFDTFGACHEIQLPTEICEHLSQAAHQILASTNDEEQRKPIDAVIELFGKLKTGTARQGWAKVEPGTPATNIRMVWPRWYHRVWAKFTSLWNRNKT
jgi:hypothetical protein